MGGCCSSIRRLCTGSCLGSASIPGIYGHIDAAVFQAMPRVVLVVIDGFGIAAEDGHGDATVHARYIEQMKHCYGWMKLHSSGRYVGLPDGYAGNSEVGHMTIGAGRRMKQSLLKINEDCANGSFCTRLAEVRDACRIHLVGLTSDGGVHSHIDHLKFLLKHLPDSTVVHAIADGIDTAPDTFAKYLNMLDGNIASIAGRYYAMDRDGNNERTSAFYDTIVSTEERDVCRGNEHAAGCTSSSLAKKADQIKRWTQSEIRQLVKNDTREYAYYKSHEFADEYIPPTLLRGDRIRPCDTVVFFNYRADRMRQIVSKFQKFRNVYTLVDYGVGFAPNILIHMPHPINTLPEWLARHGKTQAHIAESEKYAHVTYFFNGGREKRERLEDRMVVSSPRAYSFADVPETAMDAVGRACIRMIEKSVDFIVINLAGPDLVGHTGDFKKVCAAVKEADRVVEYIHKKCTANGYALFITADHGNAEQMIVDGRVCKSHTTNQVPLVIALPDESEKKIDFGHGAKNGELADIAPSILDLMGILAPSEMKGKSLLF